MEVDELDSELNDLSNDEEVQLTSAEVIEMIEEAWLNEKFAPEILPHKLEVVECLLRQISYMEDNIKGLPHSDFRRGLYQLELDRIRYLVTSYMRNRMEKIETFVYYILKQEEERRQKGEDLWLTDGELDFATSYKRSLDEHLGSVLNFQSVLPLDDWHNEPVTPNMHSFVFLKSKKDIEGVVIDDGGQEQGDLVDLNPGSKMIISYMSVANLIKCGDVNLT